MGYKSFFRFVVAISSEVLPLESFLFGSLVSNLMREESHTFSLTVTIVENDCKVCNTLKKGR